MDARVDSRLAVEDSPLPYPEVQPFDEHNRELVEHVRPPAWRNPVATGRYNLVVIGAGTAGLVAAEGAARMGARVALVERELMGGDCLNVGSVPSKTLIRCANALVQAREARAFGVLVPETLEVDFATVMERVRAVRAGLAPRDSAHRFRELGVDVFLGEARFTGKNQVQVGDQTLRFSRACIATGSRSLAPPVFGLAAAGFLTNQTVFSLTALPRRLVVLGGGSTGCELAQAFARLGSRVTLIEAAPRLLPREDREAAAFVEEALRRDGVTLRLNARVGRVERRDDERVLSFSDEGEASILTDELLVATGRRPMVEGLHLEAAGIDFDERDGIRVDDFLRTTNGDVYAAGDCCTAHRFTHVADAMSRVVLKNALLFGRERASALAIPWVTFTDPEIAHVGLTEREAREQGLLLRTVRVDLADLDRAVIEGDPPGYLAVHLERDGDRVLGATFVGRGAGEAISELGLAIQEEVPLGRLGRLVHPYPTRSEAVRKAAESLLSARAARPLARMLLRGLMAVRR
jgi:pyruvate/2-oxoglutarate dehydrogenase complex dihydrolipoamide dehydrogenase (E3) component